MNKDYKDYKDSQLQQLLGNTLKWGVNASLVCCGIGLVLHFLKNGNQIADYHQLPSIPTHFSLHNFGAGLLHLESSAYMLLGVMCLIATPVFRILLSILGFLKENDKTYVLISLIVLGIIIISFFMGVTH